MSGEKNFGKLKWINPTHIKPSDENPRSDDFYKDKDFLRLKESVAKYGVIVPVIIKELLKKEGRVRYQLIDGERRWKAAIETNQAAIPAYVLPPERNIDILATMFQIHMNQEGWDAIEQARALEKIISELKNNLKRKFDREEKLEKELVKKLKDITGMDDATAWSRIRFFRWPQKLREYIYNEPNRSYYSYAVEIEAKIVEPVLRNFPNIKEKIPPDDMREAIFQKVIYGYITRAEEIRDASILTKRRSDKREIKEAKRLLLKFIKDKTFTFSEAREQYLYLFPEESRKPSLSFRKLINTIRSLIKALNEYNTDISVKKLKPKQKYDLKDILNSLLLTINQLIKRLNGKK